MPTRREYLAAAATLTGTTLAGCTGESMSEDEANSVIDDATIVGEVPATNTPIARVVDSEAGVVLYMAGIARNYGAGMTSVPMEETDLSE